jgi:hypothetical protein
MEKRRKTRLVAMTTTLIFKTKPAYKTSSAVNTCP